MLLCYAATAVPEQEAAHTVAAEYLMFMCPAEKPMANFQYKHPTRDQHEGYAEAM